ncbi:hypothetical protein RQP46_003083 [Phenoliferia psychrophenolica]
MSVAGPSVELPSAGEVKGQGERKRTRAPREERDARKEAKRKAQDDAAAALALLPPQPAQDDAPTTDPWAWYPLADPTALTCPVIFSPDSLYCFIAAGATVKIYTVANAQLLSTLTLTPPPQASDAAVTAADSPKRRTKVSCLIINPDNPLQLIVGGLDGLLRLWDYREGTLLRTLDLGDPIQHLCAHASLPNQVFVALVTTPPPGEESAAAVRKPKQRGGAHDDVDAGEAKAGVYAISLKPQALAKTGAGTTNPTSANATFPRTPSRRMRLAQPRVVRALAVSPSGAFLISLNPGTVNICQTRHLNQGFATQLDSTDTLTCLAFHPTESYFATGNARGQIRLWYGVLDGIDAAKSKDEVKSLTVTGPAGTTEPKTSTAVFHWHAHPVASLAFTPNGAYLLSGGEEAVMVLWQLHSGHREFVPRLGAPIVTLSVTNSVHAEQQVVARLRDGTVIFVGSQKLKISHTISGIKADPVRLSDLTNRPSVRVPLAIEPLTKSLVVSAGHPSSLQFYSPSDDSQVLEVEISPSNRVAGVGKPIEPTRVERVAFSVPASKNGKGERKGEYWMATSDVWENGDFAVERQLKFWRHRADGSGFTLATRVDRPHDSAITSLSFSPSTDSPLLLTTSTDGRIKVWAFVGDSWRCRTSLEYRSFAPVDAAWSHDGSMFAVAHARSVTLWSLASNTLLHSFPCAAISPATNVEFIGEEGTILLAGGKHGTMTWDLLSYEETFSMALDIQNIATRPQSSSFIATERALPSSSHTVPSSSAFVIDLAPTVPTTTAHHLPFPIRQATWLPTLVPLSPTDISLAVINARGEVVLVGDAVANAFAVPTKASRLPSASTGQSRLFDEIFGAAEKTPATSSAAEKAPKRERAMPKSLAALDAPSHTLPAPRLLWKTMLGAFAVGGNKSDEKEKRDGPEGMDVDEDESAVEARPHLVFSPVESLAEIFKARMTLGPGSASPRKVAR